MTRIVLIMIMVGVVMSACGTKGPLYLPEQRYPLPADAKK
jgi:predicted small lipoprotein YifL